MNADTKNELIGLEINLASLKSAIAADEARDDKDLRQRTIADHKRAVAEIEKRIAEINLLPA